MEVGGKAVDRPNPQISEVYGWERFSSNDTRPGIVGVNDQSVKKRRKPRREATLKCYTWPPTTAESKDPRREPDQTAEPADRGRPRGLQEVKRDRSAKHTRRLTCPSSFFVVAGEVSPRLAKPQASPQVVFGHSCNFTPAVRSPRVMLPVVDNRGMMHAWRAW